MLVSPLLSLFFRSLRKRRQRMVHRKNQWFSMLFQVSPRSLREDGGSTNTSKSVANRSLKIKLLCCCFRLLVSFFSRPCKKHPREAKMTPRRVPGTPPERPKRRQEHPRSAPRGAKSDPRGARNTLGGTPERSWEPPSAPDGAQRPPEAPREASRSNFGMILRGFWKGLRVIFDPPRAFLWTSCGSLLRFLYPQQSTITQ